jgi:hypothetical protein
VETAVITLSGDSQYVTMTMHDNFTGEDLTWTLPLLSAKELGHSLLRMCELKG